MAERPNILFITTDQHRFDATGFWGSPDVHTPELDRMAANGVEFERAYVTNPVCMPSRASLLLGQFPDAHGVRRNGIEVPDQPWGVARVMRGNGWRTGMFGKTHFCPLRRDYQPDAVFHDWRVGETYYGFEERAITHDLKDVVSDIPSHTGGTIAADPRHTYVLDDYVDWIQGNHPEMAMLALREGLPVGEEAVAPELWTSQLPAELHQSTWIVDRTIEFIDRESERPFFAWCSFVDPHHPFNAPQAYRDQYNSAKFAEPVWREGELRQRSLYHRRRHDTDYAPWRTHWREYRAQYYAMISLIDDQIGRLIRHLEARGLAESTAIIFSSDHGEMLGDHGLPRKGLFHYEPLIRVPLLVYWPAEIARGLRQRGIVQSVDIAATILDLAGVHLPPQHQGLSLAPWCRGERDDSPRAYALVQNGGEGPHYDPWPELRTLVTERWKLQYYVKERHVELDDLANDRRELNPPDPNTQRRLVRELLEQLVEAGSAASVWGPHVGRW